jgi:hypothetical protein
VDEDGSRDSARGSGHSPYTKGNFQFERIVTGGEQSIQCLTFALRSNMFMTYGALDQNGEGSAAECRSRPTPTSYFIARGSAALVTQVPSVRASSISILGGGIRVRSTGRSHRSHRVDHAQAPPSTVERLRKYARGSGLTIGAIVTAALNPLLRTLRKDG